MKPTIEEMSELLNDVVTIRNQMEDAGETSGEDYEYIRGLYDALQWIRNGADRPDVSGYENI